MKIADTSHIKRIVKEVIQDILTEESGIEAGQSWHKGMGYNTDPFSSFKHQVLGILSNIAHYRSADLDLVHENDLEALWYRVEALEGRATSLEGESANHNSTISNINQKLEDLEDPVNYLKRKVSNFNLE